MLTPILLLLAAGPIVDGGSSERVSAMHQALGAVLSLQPLLADPAAFRDRANKPTIEADLVALGHLDHAFVTPTEAGAEAFSKLFAESVEQSRQDLKAGETELARARLRGLTGLCFACHTRARATRDYVDSSGRIDALGLSPLRRAEALATTRQFDRAIEAWGDAVRSAPGAEAEVYERATALRKDLAVLVRVKDNRAATVALLSQQLLLAEASPTLKRPLLAWLADARRWQADRFDADRATATELYEKAKGLVEASGASHSPLADEAHFLGLLRASGYLHRALELQPRAKFRGEALYLLGLTSAATLDPMLWDLDSVYLESCIRENPHTQLAMRCAARMDDRVWFGWTGSGGTRIPEEILKKGTLLRQLAEEGVAH